MNDLRGPAAVLLAAAVAIAGCGSGLPGRDPLHVNAVSGGKVDLTNTTWEWCADAAGGGSELYREAHGEEGAISFRHSTWDAPGCTGSQTAVLSPTGSAYGEARGDIPVTWAGTPPAGAPDPPPLATKVLLSTVDGFYAGDVYLVDDRDPAHRVLYTGALGSPRDDSGFPTQLHPVGEVER